jgi:hypothetical protein
MFDRSVELYAIPRFQHVFCPPIKHANTSFKREQDLFSAVVISGVGTVWLEGWECKEKRIRKRVSIATRNCFEDVAQLSAMTIDGLAFTSADECKATAFLAILEQLRGCDTVYRSQR